MKGSSTHRYRASKEIVCSNRLQQAEREVRELLQKYMRAALISCWTESDHESSLMWETYTSEEGVAVRTTVQHLQESIRSVPELPVTFGQVEYVDYRRKEVPRFGWAPLFHKRMEYRGEGEVRAVGRFSRRGTRLIWIFGSIRTLPNSEAGTYL